MNMTLLSATITLILVMDPLGNIPVFISVLKPFSPQRQRFIICREVFIAFIIILIFLLCGKYILHGLHITTPALSISGGIILFVIAIRMIFPPQKKSEDAVTLEEPFIVPLAVPLTAGPSALATVVLLTSRAPQHMMHWAIAVVFANIIFLIIMLSSSFLIKLLKKRGLIAIERLMGMILTTVAVQMFLDGISHFYNLPHIT